MFKKVLTTHEIAKHCHVTMATVTNWIKDGSLKGYKTKGGHRRVYREDLEEFLKKYQMPFSVKPRILIVDDDESIRLGLKKLFEREGFIVSLADNGLQAGVLLEMTRPGLVILDLIMPGLDGFYVCQQIKAHSHFKDIKVVVLTGYPSKENIQKAKDFGVDELIAKPVENEIILRKINDLMGIKH